MIEAAGSPAAMADALEVAGQEARVVYVGIDIGAEVPAKLGLIQSKALRMRGLIGSVGLWPRTIRFLASGKIDATSIVTATFPLDDALARARRGARHGEQHQGPSGDQRMKAAVYHGRHDIRIQSVPEPGDPGPGEVVLEVARAAICGTDSSEWAHGPLLTRPPVTLGHEFVGRVVSIGEGVVGLSHGDRVVSGAAVSCGHCEWCRAGRTNLCSTYLTLGLQLNGGLAQLVKTPAAVCRQVPDVLLRRRGGDGPAAGRRPARVAADERQARADVRRDRRGGHRLVHPRRGGGEGHLVR